MLMTRGFSRKRADRKSKREELVCLMGEEGIDSESSDGEAEQEKDIDKTESKQRESKAESSFKTEKDCSNAEDIKTCSELSEADVNRLSQGSFSSGFETADDTQSYTSTSETSSNRSSAILESLSSDSSSCFDVVVQIEKENGNGKQELVEMRPRTLSIETHENVPTLRTACSSDSVFVDIRHLFTLSQSSTGNLSTDGEYIETVCELEESSSTAPQVYFQDTPEEPDACRICHCGTESGPLISPCLCMGTVRFVHHSCLMDWLQRCVKTKCELCLYPIAIRRKTKSLKKWRLPGSKPTPIIWLLTFVIALTLNVASIAKDGSQHCISNPCIIFYVVGALGAMLGFAFFYHWLLKSIRYVQKWVALNEEWNLIGPENLRKLGNANLAVSKQSLFHPPLKQDGKRSKRSVSEESSESDSEVNESNEQCIASTSCTENINNETMSTNVNENQENADSMPSEADKDNESQCGSDGASEDESSVTEQEISQEDDSELTECSVAQIVQAHVV